jgi:hypothetical protein
MTVEVGDHAVDRDAIAQHITGPVGMGQAQHFLDLALDTLNGRLDFGDRRLERELHCHHLQRHHPRRRDVGLLPLQLADELLVRTARHHAIEAIRSGSQLALLNCLDALRMQLDEFRLCPTNDAAPAARPVALPIAILSTPTTPIASGRC